MNERGGAARLLRWYPRSWRARYGEEFVALIEDVAGTGRLPARMRWSVAWSGLRERAHDLGMAGRPAPAADRVRDGALAVLWAWTVLVVAAAAFAKGTEHFRAALPAGAGAGAGVAMVVLRAAAVAGGLAAVTGAVVALPAFTRHVRSEGWHGLRRTLRAAVALTVAAAAATGGLAAWAHTLDRAHRNGADPAYVAGFVAWGLLCAACAGAWTHLASRAARRVHFTRMVLRFEAAAAAVVAGAVAVVMVAALVWWGEMATAAPWFLHGARPGTPGLPVDGRLLLTGTAMAASVALAGLGLARIAAAWRELRPA